MYQTVKMTSGFLDLLSKIIVGIEVEHVGHKVKRILIVRDLGLQPREVKPIGQVIFVDLAEILVSSRRDKLKESNMISFINPVHQDKAAQFQDPKTS